jgi:hypothetical protein
MRRIVDGAIIITVSIIKQYYMDSLVEYFNTLSEREEERGNLQGLDLHMLIFCFVIACGYLLQSVQEINYA